MTHLDETDIGLMRIQGDLPTFIRAGRTTALATARHNRALVLAHHDLAQKLTEPPLNFSRPDAWNGYVPPERTATGLLNPSPQRAALLDLLATAHRRNTHGAAS